MLSLRTQEIGQKMRDRMAYNASGVSGQLACGDQITLHTTQAATIPMTGVSFGTHVESYAGQPISSIAMGEQRHGGDTGRGGDGAGGHYRADSDSIGRRRRAELAGGDAGHRRQSVERPRLPGICPGQRSLLHADAGGLAG